MRLGETIPDFRAETSQGRIRLYEYLGDDWGILFSHPADFTPVCTTELGAVARLMPEFRKRKTRVIALSVDPVESHTRWIRDIEETQGCQVNFPVIADPDFAISKALDFVHPAVSDRFTVRSVLVIGPDKKVKLILTYPASTGRNFDEILRVLDSLQLTERFPVATPADWKPGQDVVVALSVKSEDIKTRFPKGHREITPYLRITPQPDLE